MRAAQSIRSWRKRPVLIASGVLGIALLLALANPHGKVARVPTAEAVARAPTLEIVAAHRIPLGTVIAAADIRGKTVPGDAAPGAILSSEAALGHIAGRNFAPGDMLLQGDLRDAGALGIAARVPAGQRAFSIRVAEDEIVGGFLQSGDHVDIFATIPGSAFPAKDSQNVPDRSRTVLLLQNVMVLAVGENTATRGSVQSSARTVSVALPPLPLARLALALRFGKVSLAIRKPGDDSVADGATAALGDLVPVQAPSEEVSVAAPASRHTAGIPFYSGTRVSVVGWSNRP